MSTIETRLNSSFFTAAAILVAAVGLLFFYHLNEDEVSSEAEARVLLTATEMNRNETWTIPVVGGQGRWEIPPLYVWTVKLASFMTEGRVTPLASRLPGAVAMALLVLLAAWWAYKHFSAYPRADGIETNAEGFALLSGLILATNPQILKLARSGVNDTIFAFFCFAAIYCLGQSFESRRSFFAGRSWRQWLLFAYFLIGLAMLTKGPAAFLFVLIPYMTMCWSYRLRKPDPIHIAGLLLAAAVGGWWYVLAAATDPEAKRVFLNQLLAMRFGPDAENHRPFYFYFTLIFKSYSPWIFLAGAMVYRNLRLGERTPTLVTWSSALLAGILWLSLVGSKRDQYFLPVAPFIMLLAADGLMRWDFDSRLGQAFRVLIRTLRYALIVLGIPISFLLGSEIGIGFSILAILICALFALHRRRTSYVYAVWERTVHGAALLVLVLGIYEAVYALDFVPRQDLRSRTSAFMTQMGKHLPENAAVYIYGKDDSALISYYLGRLPRIVYKVEELEESEFPDTYLISDADVKALSRNPRLIPLVVRFRSDSSRVRSALFQYLPASRYPDPITPEARFSAVPPLRLAVLGDAGRADSDLQRVIARKLDDLSEDHPLHAVLMLGDALSGDSRLQRMDFYGSFERPYRRQLRDGIPFFGLPGEKDRELRPLVVRYPLLQMNGRSYYAQSFYGGLLDYFALDSFELADDSPESDAQWKWIEDQLAASQALWKVVALYRPIVSLSPDSKVSREIRDRLLPLLEKYGVQLVLSSAEPVYQRIKDPKHRALFISAGWSGRIDDPNFPEDSRLRASYTEEEGLVLLEFTAGALRFRAVNKHGKTVDQGSIDRAGLEIPEEPKAKADATKPASEKSTGRARMRPTGRTAERPRPADSGQTSPQPAAQAAADAPSPT